MRFIIVLFCVIFAYADHFEFEDEYYEHIPRDLSFLELSKKQKNKIMDLLIEYRKKAKKIQKFENKLAKKLNQKFISDNFSKDDYYNLIIQYKKEKTKIEADFFKQIHTILNKSQRKKFIYFIKEWEIE